MTNDDGSIDVHRDDAADWLIRSALPRFLRLVVLDDDADYFAALPPFEYAPTGRIRGWQGVSKRLAAVETDMGFIRRKVLAATADERHAMARERSDAELQVRAAADFARRRMRPSRAGWTAFRLRELVDESPTAQPVAVERRQSQQGDA